MVTILLWTPPTLSSLDCISWPPSNPSIHLPSSPPRCETLYKLKWVCFHQKATPTVEKLKRLKILLSDWWHFASPLDGPPGLQESKKTVENLPSFQISKHISRSHPIQYKKQNMIVLSSPECWSREPRRQRRPRRRTRPSASPWRWTPPGRRPARTGCSSSWTSSSGPAWSGSRCTPVFGFLQWRDWLTVTFVEGGWR